MGRRAFTAEQIIQYLDMEGGLHGREYASGENQEVEP